MADGQAVALFFGIVFLHQFHDVVIAGNDPEIILPAMRHKTIGAILIPVFGIAEIAAALLAQRKQRAIAEQAVEILGMVRLVAGKVFALGVLEKGIMLFFHGKTHSLRFGIPLL